MRKPLWYSLSIFLLAITLMACTTNTKPFFDSSNDSDMPEQIRRYTGRPAVDFVHRFDSRAFERATKDNFGIVTEDKQEVIDRHGRPDYFRENVKAQRNETFDEWVYWDDNVICQFISGELVYEGELLDSDRTLVTWGYPSWASFQEYELGPVREHWIYEGTITVGIKSFDFSNGKLVFQATN